MYFLVELICRMACLNDVPFKFTLSSELLGPPSNWVVRTVDTGERPQMDHHREQSHAAPDLRAL